MNPKRMILSAFVAMCVAATDAGADTAGYYVSRDGRETLQVAGQPVSNPNFERLTLLFDHGDHFHSIGRFGSPTGQLPEAYIGGRIMLFEGTGADAGRFVSKSYLNDDPASEYSNLRFHSIHDLASFPSGSDEAVLYNSSGGRWSRLPLDGSLVALEVVEISTGLHATIGDGSEVASETGDRLTLGAGNSFSNLLQFYTDAGIPSLTDLSATFRLIDLSTGGSALLSSGEFRFDMTTIPEPNTVLLVGLGLAGVVGLRWKQRRRVAIA